MRLTAKPLRFLRFKERLSHPRSSSNCAFIPLRCFFTAVFKCLRSSCRCSSTFFCTFAAFFRCSRNCRAASRRSRSFFVTSSRCRTYRLTLLIKQSRSLRSLPHRVEVYQGENRKYRNDRKANLMCESDYKPARFTNFVHVFIGLQHLGKVVIWALCRHTELVQFWKSDTYRLLCLHVAAEALFRRTIHS